MQGYLITKCIFWAGPGGRGGGAGATDLPGSAPDPNCSTMQPFALTQVCTFYIFIVFKIYSNLYNVYVTCTHFSIEFTQFNKFNLSNILKFFLEIQTIYTSNVHNFTLNLYNFVHLMYLTYSNQYIYIYI